MSFCGTPEYLAPEMITKKGHNKSVDWWAIGVIIYEMVIGVTPFFNRNRNMLLMKIKNSKIIFPDQEKYQIFYSKQFIDIVSKLLLKDKDKRLGNKGDWKEILQHPFFEGIDIDKLLKKQIKPIFKPDLSKHKIDTKYFNAESDERDLVETIVPQEKVKKIESVKD